MTAPALKYLTARLLSGVLSAITLALLFRLLGPAEFARFSIAALYSHTLNLALFHWFGLYGLRVAPHDPLAGAQVAESLRYVSLRIVVCGLLCIPVLYLLGGADTALWGTLALIFAGTQGRFDCGQNLAIASNAPAEFLRISLSRAAGQLLFGGAVAYLTTSAAAVLASQAAVNLVTAPSHRASLTTELVRTTTLRAWRYGFPLCGALVLTTGSASLLRTLLAHWCSLAEAGRFSAVYDLLTFGCSAIFIAINSGAYPLIAGSFDRGEISTSYERLHETLVTALTGGVAIFTVGVAFTAPFLTYALGLTPTPELHALFALSLGVGVLTGIRICYTDTPFQLLHRSSTLLKITIATQGVTVLLAAVWIPTLCVQGIAAALGSGALLHLCISFALTPALGTRPPFPWQKLLPLIPSLICAALVLWQGMAGGLLMIATLCTAGFTLFVRGRAT